MINKTPTGVSMMLKALGIEFNPEMIKKTVDSIEEVRQRLQNIEEKVDEILRGLKNAGIDTTNTTERDSSSSSSISGTTSGTNGSRDRGSS
jgi:hypothetical protein